jgi:hypothetical protein
VQKLKPMQTYTFHTKLESTVLQLFDVGNLFGKEVIVSIIEVPDQTNEKKKRNWNFLGAVNLKKRLGGFNNQE